MTTIRLRLRAAVVRLLRPFERVWYVVGLAIADLDADDLRAVTAVCIYLVLGTVVIVWASSMFVLVRWMVGY